MSSNLERLQNTLAAGRVRRWHTDDKAPQTVGEHTFGVMVLLVYLLQEEGDALGTVEHETADERLRRVADLTSLFVGALVHDATELFTGDIPAPARAEIEDSDVFELFEERAREKVFTRRLSFEDRLKIHYADKLEAMLFARRTQRAEAAEYNADIVRRQLKVDDITSVPFKSAVESLI